MIMMSRREYRSLERIIIVGILDVHSVIPTPSKRFALMTRRTP